MMEPLLELAIRGEGIAYLPNFVARSSMDGGRLIELLKRAATASGALHILSPASHYPLPKVRVWSISCPLILVAVCSFNHCPVSTTQRSYSAFGGFARPSARLSNERMTAIGISREINHPGRTTASSQGAHSAMVENLRCIEGSDTIEAVELSRQVTVFRGKSRRGILRGIARNTDRSEARQISHLVDQFESLPLHRRPHRSIQVHFFFNLAGLQRTRRRAGRRVRRSAFSRLNGFSLQGSWVRAAGSAKPVVSMFAHMIASSRRRGM